MVAAACCRSRRPWRRRATRCWAATRELDAYGDAYERTRTDGVPHAVFVVGSPGIGKTTLVAGAARRLHGRGASVSCTAKPDDAIGIVYQPFVRALGALIDHLPTDAVLAVHVANHGAQLARLVPDLARRTGIAPEAVAVSSGTDPYLLFGAVAHLWAPGGRRAAGAAAGRSALGGQPDDPAPSLPLHDGASPPDPRAGDLPDTDIGPDDPLARLVSDLSPTVSERIHLHGLDRDAARTLTRERCDDPAAADRVGR